MKNYAFTMLVFLSLLVSMFPISAQECRISTGHGLLADVDCDRVPDIFDNCPGIFNPDQTDEDRNEVGDPCDQLYQSYMASFQPPQVIEPTIEKTEEKPVQEQPKKEEKKTVQTLSEEAFPYATVLTEETQMKLLSQHDVAAGGAGVVYPVRILNKADRIKQYALTMFNVDAFGTYRIDPGSVVLIQPNEEKTLYVYIQADSTARLGEHSFTLRIESGEEMAQAVLRANIFGERQPASAFKISDKTGMALLTVLVIILLIALVVVLSRKSNGKSNGKSKGGKVRYSNY